MFLFTVFNLTNGIDVDQTKSYIESYQKDNQDIIRRNKLKKVTDCLLTVILCCLLWLISEFYIHLSSICKWIICSLHKEILKQSVIATFISCISKTRGRLSLQSHDEELIERLLEEEREVRQFTQQQMVEEEELVQKEKEKQKNELINDLVRSFVDISELMSLPYE